jgi:uncharacterized protein YuzE
MKIGYYSETNSLYIDLSEHPSVESREVSEGIVLDYAADGSLVGIDIDSASRVSGSSVWLMTAALASYAESIPKAEAAGVVCVGGPIACRHATRSARQPTRRASGRSA